MSVPQKPRGRIPKDPVKLAAYEKQMAAYLAYHGKFVETGDYTTPVITESISTTPEDDEFLLARMSERFKGMQLIAEGVVAGAINSMLVTGPGGIGKTETIKNVFESNKKEFGLTIQYLEGGVVSPLFLYQKLWESRNFGNILVLDDSDSIWYDESALNILKGALDSSTVRTVTWGTNSNILKAENIPNSFPFEGAIVFISNLNFDAIIGQGRSKISQHLQALQTRTIYVDLRCHQIKELLAWVSFMVRDKKILLNRGLTEEQQEIVLSYLKDNAHKLRHISIRTAMQIGSFLVAQSDTWESLAELALFKH